MMGKVRHCFWIGFLLLMLGCRNAAAVTPTLTKLAPATLTGVTQTATKVPTATIRPTKTPLPSPTPFVSLISAQDQTVKRSGKIVIESVTVEKEAWVALFSADFLVGYDKVPQGTTETIELTVDPLSLGELVTAVLYKKEGTAFEVDSAESIQNNGQPVQTGFQVKVDAPLPKLVLKDQVVGEDGRLLIDSAELPEAGWVTIQTDGPDGQQVGLQYLPKGKYTQLPVPILWRNGTRQLHAILYRDEKPLERFDENDPVVAIRNIPLQATATIDYPPDIYVLDQPVVENQVVVDRILTNRPSWLSIANDDGGGRPGLIIGFVLLQEGVNQNVIVPLQNKPTTTLFAQIHEDIDDLGQFEYPTADLPIKIDGAPRFFPFRTDAGNYLISADQPLSQTDKIATITIPSVIVDTPAFVVIYTDNGGNSADIIGQASVTTGINRNVVVTIDGSRVTPILHAILHTDLGERQKFEFPDGNDYLLLNQRRIIDAPFQLWRAP